MSADDVGDATQPALSRLALDVRECRRSLIDGFDSRRAVIRWCIDATAATLGRLPEGFYATLHEDMVTADYADDARPPLLGALLGDDAAVPNASARAARVRLAASTYSPAASRAVRGLREDAQEEAPEDGDSVRTDPSREQHPAMRPSLSEIRRHQHRAIDHLLAGFDDTAALLEWGDVVDLASHGCIPDHFVASLATSPVTRRVVLVGDDWPDPGRFAPAREVAAAWLLRYVRAGTRERYRHAAEVSDPSGGDRSKEL